MIPPVLKGRFYILLLEIHLILVDGKADTSQIRDLREEKATGTGEHEFS